MTPQAPQLVPGDILADRYRLERVIGEGGMGLVFAAHDRLEDRVVALKVLAASADEEALERFHREARAARRLTSEHVVRVFDVRHAEGETPPFIVMELLEGHDLSALLEKHGPLPIAEAIGYVLQVCEALVEAHALGIVHRDLKPSNLYVTRRPDGTPLVKILDFGISKTQEDDDIKLTTTRSVFGSPAYMSPEQIRSAKHVDARADIWSVAVVLYELLSGQLPFAGDNAASMLASISADPPRSLRASSPHAVPLELERIVEACLVKDRERRLASVADLAQGLTAIASGRPLSAGLTMRLAPSMPPPSPSMPLFAPTILDPAMARTDRALVLNPRSSARNRVVLGGIAGAAAVLVLAFTVVRVQLGPAHPAPSGPAVEPPTPAPPAVSVAVPVATVTASAADPSPAMSSIRPPRPRLVHTGTAPAASSLPPPPAPAPSASHVRDVHFDSRF